MNTAQLRDELRELAAGVENGSLPLKIARFRLQIAKAEIDSLKVEISAEELGREFGSVEYDPANRKRARSAPALKKVS